MKHSILVFLFLFSGLAGLSAQNSEVFISPDSSTDGTWQLQVVNSRNQPYIPGDIDSLVNTNRHATEVVYLQIGTAVRLKILPFSAIKKNDFEPVEKIAYITE